MLRWNYALPRDCHFWQIAVKRELVIEKQNVFLEPALGDRRAVRHTAAGQPARMCAT